MIRTPQAKQQAEILIAELNRRGTKLPWGHALEIVARMQGFRSWNALSAAAPAASAAPTVPAPAVVQGPGSYLVPGIAALAQHGPVTDARLADYLGHFQRDQSTTLLVWTAPDGEQYELRLCGRGPKDAPDGHNHAFFEWLNAGSDPVGDVFDTISANPQAEIASLQRMLG